MRLFTGLGFTAAAEPLLNEAATAEAMRRLVTETLVRLAPEDSLVMFFAGHGYTRTSDLGNVSVKTGYLIPVDATEPQGRITANWLRLDGWLSDIARLPARHVLVLIDACHSGVALNMEARPAEDRAVLARRRSRQVITSALDDQRAMDGGPYPGHSLFTGCLIEAFSGGLVAPGEHFVTGGEIGQYLKRRVAAYPPMTQTPDVGAFELDDRGDLIIPVSGTPAPAVLHDLEAPAPAMTVPPVEWEPEPVSSSRTTRPRSTRPAAPSARTRRASFWHRAVRTATIGKSLTVGALTWMLIFNVFVVYEGMSDGPSVYIPYGPNGTRFPSVLISAAIQWASWIAFLVLCVATYLFARRLANRQDRSGRTPQSVLRTARICAVVAASLALGVVFTGFSLNYPGHTDWVGTAAVLSGVAAFLAGMFTVGFVRALLSP